MVARLNRSPSGVVVWCRECIHWSAISDSVAFAHDLAVAHEKAVHPGCRTAYMNRAKYRERLTTHRY